MSEQRPTPEKQPAPDFGEPWHEQEPPHPISVRAGVYWLNPRQFNRAVSCVNACAGMADPAAEIQAMRDKLADIRQRLKGHADSRLDGENGLAAATMRGFDGLQAENDAMREAINGAYEMLQGIEEHLDGNRGMFVQAAIAKLQPFLP